MKRKRWHIYRKIIDKYHLHYVGLRGLEPSLIYLIHFLSISVDWSPYLKIHRLGGCEIAREMSELSVHGELIWHDDRVRLGDLLCVPSHRLSSDVGCE